MISAGCSTAYFAPLPPYGAYVDVNGKEHAGTDAGEVFRPPPPPSPYQKDRFNPTGLGEHLLKDGPNGAVVYIGCNTGGQPCGVTLVEGFLIALRSRSGRWSATAGRGGVRCYYDKEGLEKLKPNSDWYPPSIFFQGMKYMFFGDPTLPFPRRRPARSDGRNGPTPTPRWRLPSDLVGKDFEWIVYPRMRAGEVAETKEVQKRSILFHQRREALHRLYILFAVLRKVHESTTYAFFFLQNLKAAFRAKHRDDLGMTVRDDAVGEVDGRAHAPAKPRPVFGSTMCGIACH